MTKLGKSNHFYHDEIEDITSKIEETPKEITDSECRITPLESKTPQTNRGLKQWGDVAIPGVLPEDWGDQSTPRKESKAATVINPLKI